MNNYIDKNTQIEESAVFGYNCIIEKDVVIGSNVRIGHNVIIYEGSTIGANCQIHDNVVIGKLPMRAKRSALKQQSELKPTVIGEGCTIGTNTVIYRGADIASEVFIADLATVREKVAIGTQTIIGRGVAVENECEIGERCKIETNAYITAFSTIGDDVFIAPGVVTSNDNYMGRTEKRFSEFRGCIVENGGRVGANATLLPGIVVEKEGVIGAGSVATRKVESEWIVVGTPAKKFRKVDTEQLLDS